MHSNDYISFTLFVGLVGFICVFTLKYIVQVLRRNVEEEEEEQELKRKDVKADVKPGTASNHSAGKQSAKRKAKSTWLSKNDNKQSFSHLWLLTSLKGHSGQILDMDLSANGKYLVSCADEDPLDPGGQQSNNTSLEEINRNNDSFSTTSSSISDSSRPPSADPSPRKTLSRRQRKNRRRDDQTSPPQKTSPDINVPLKQFAKLNITERALGTYLRSYLLSPEQMLALGYPIESCEYPGRAVIFKSEMLPRQRPAHFDVSRSRFDVNAREFIPRRSYDSGGDSSSGHGSGNTSDSDDVSSDFTDFDSNATESGCFETNCVRCHQSFYLSDKKYLTQERCCYHWGKLVRCSDFDKSVYECCKGREAAKGCATSKLHVWSGLSAGFNGPFDQYVRTKPRKTPPSDGNFGIYALDCEMCYTVTGLELAKITVLGPDGRLVYDSFVRPDNEIVDYNTRFSGITARDFNPRRSAKTLREVQNDLMGFMSADTVLVGHGLENDLRALRIMHGTVVDTAVTFPHFYGLPYRRSLKSLASSILRRQIQSNGHNAHEDAKAAMELILWRVKKDFGSILGSDRTVMVWDIKDLNQLSHKSLRINVEFDHATSSKFSPDSKAVIINKCDANAIEIYKLEKKKDAWLSNGHKSITFSKVHKDNVINIGISCNGKFIMSSSNKSDVVIFDLKGQKLGAIDSKFTQNYAVKISPCGRFVAISGSSKDVLIYEINFSTSGEFQNIKEAFKLKHSAEVFDVAFDADTSHIATVSEDGNWYLFHTKISYKHGDLPQLIKHAPFPISNTQRSVPARVALSPNAEVVTVASGNTVSFYATHDCHLDCQIDGPDDDEAITSCAFDSDGSHLYVGVGRYIRVFRNVTGYRCGIETAKEKLKQNQTSATRERLRQLIVDFEEKIRAIET